MGVKRGQQAERVREALLAEAQGQELIICEHCLGSFWEITLVRRAVVSAATGNIDVQNPPKQEVRCATCQRKAKQDVLLALGGLFSKAKDILEREIG